MRIALLLGVALVLAAPKAHAVGNSAPLDVNRFHPAAGSGRLLTIDLADVGPPYELVGQFVLHYADLPLVYTLGNRFQNAVVRNRVTADLAVSFSILERLQFSLALPVTLFQGGDLITYSDPTDGSARALPQAAGAGLEDLRLQVKGRFWSNEQFRVGGAIETALPTGNANAYLGSSGVTGTARVFGDYLWNQLAAGVTLGWRYAFVEEQLLGVQAGNSFLYGVGAQYEVYRYNDVPLSLVGEVYGLVHGGGVVASPAEAMLAMKAQYRDFTFLLGAGPGLNHGYGEPNIRVLGGVAWAWQYHPPPPPPVFAPAPVVALPPQRQAVVVPVEGDRLQLWDAVYFDFNQATIKPVSFPLLDEVARVLVARPELGRIRVDGHTDDVGNDDYNLDLSRRRARAVSEYLVQHGVPAARLSSEGYGERCPVTTNETDEGRATNRRVDFILVERELVHPAPGKCPEKPKLPAKPAPTKQE